MNVTKKSSNAVMDSQQSPAENPSADLPQSPGSCLKVGCVSALSVSTLALVLLIALVAFGCFEYREPSLIQQVEPPLTERLHTTKFFATGTGSGSGNAILYKTDLSFDAVKLHYIEEMAKAGYSVNPRYRGEEGLEFTKDPTAKYPNVCYYLEPYPARYTTWYLAGSTAQSALEMYSPDYTLAFWITWHFPRSRNEC